MHQHDERTLVVVFHHERLDDGVLRNAELARRHGRAAALLVIVRVMGDRHGVLAQHAYRRGRRIAFLRHSHPRGWCSACSLFKRSRATCV
jgi:hypothetical protein